MDPLEDVKGRSANNASTNMAMATAIEPVPSETQSNREVLAPGPEPESWRIPGKALQSANGGPDRDAHEIRHRDDRPYGSWQFFQRTLSPLPPCGTRCILPI